MFETPPAHSPAEQTVFVTRLHWWTLVSGVYVAAAGVLCLVPVDVLRTVTTMLFGIVDTSHFALMVKIVRASAFALLGIALVMTLTNVLVRACTQCIVTNRRLILRSGALTRRSFELPLDRVEAISVSQSLLARLLNFGTLVVVGTGSTRETVRLVASPDEFRRYAMDSQTGGGSRGRVSKRLRREAVGRRPS